MTAGPISRNCNKQITRAWGRKADARVILDVSVNFYHQQFPLMPPSKMAIAATANKIRRSFLCMVNSAMIVNDKRQRGQSKRQILFIDFS
jgi:hypothetical protein